MDERVRRALQQWPNVPDIYGWLALDRRGHWRLRGEGISNPALREFIARNYLRHPSGSYIFQNGPQAVHVALEVAPYVARLEIPAQGTPWLRVQTGARLQPRRLLRGDDEALYFAGAICADDAPLAPDANEERPALALLHEQDQALLLELLQEAGGRPLSEDTLAAAWQAPEAHPVTLPWGDAALRLEWVRGSLEQPFGFIAQPTPAADPGRASPA